LALIGVARCIPRKRPARARDVPLEALRVVLQFDDGPEDAFRLRGVPRAYAVQSEASVGSNEIITEWQKVAETPRVRGQILRKRLRRAAAALYVSVPTLGRLRHQLCFVVARVRESRSNSIPRRRPGRGGASYRKRRRRGVRDGRRPRPRRRWVPRDAERLRR
jgi:hypothetical protein